MRTSIKEFAQTFEESMSRLAAKIHSLESRSIKCPDVTMQQLFLLNAISKMTCPKMSDLSKSLNVTMGNITSMTDRLIREGYVLRKDDPDDRRIVRVCLTNKGGKVISNIKKESINHFSKLLSCIAPAERIMLLNILQKVEKEITKIGSMKGAGQ